MKCHNIEFLLRARCRKRPAQNNQQKKTEPSRCCRERVKQAGARHADGDGDKMAGKRRGPNDGTPESTERRANTAVAVLALLQAGRNIDPTPDRALDFFHSASKPVVGYPRSRMRMDADPAKSVPLSRALDITAVSEGRWYALQTRPECCARRAPEKCVAAPRVTESRRQLERRRWLGPVLGTICRSSFERATEGEGRRTGRSLAPTPSAAETRSCRQSA
jgi:hypothetical protein